MYVVTVAFEIEPGHVDDFRAAVMRQAENSVTNEPDCHRFDVSVDGTDPAKFFLYEIYTDEAAAKAAGYRGITAPLTFLRALQADAPNKGGLLRLLDVDIGLVLHGEQDFE